jgi:cytochrome c biogenesis protein CcdA/thiol-disulfide isomerase/thioredoxin
MERKKDKKPKKRADTPPGNRPDKKIRIAVVLLAIVVLGCAIFFGTYLLNISKSTPTQGTVSNPVTVYYFYGAECPHCHNVTPYVQSLVQKYPDVNFQILEEWHNTTNSALAKVLFANLNQTQAGVPEAIIGDVVLSGSKEIPEKLEGAILNQTRNLTGSSRLAASLIVSESPAAANSPLTATFFYANGCSHCENVKPLIADLQTRYPELHVEMLEIIDNKTNREKFQTMLLRYNLDAGSGVPTLTIGENALVGEKEIKDHFEEKIFAEKQRIAASTNTTPVNLTPGGQPETSAISPYMVVFAALVDSTNPCGLSVLVFLLISMAAAGNRRRILLVGGVYIAAMFLFHLFVGIGLFSAMSISGLAKPFSIIGGAIALILGIVTLVDVFRNKENFLLSIPESRKGLLGTYIRKATLPAAFVLGILAGILGFSCTGGIYISILGLMGRDLTIIAGLPWLILYNLVFVLPLVLVTLLVAYGISPDRAERWRTENKRTVRVVIGVIMVALGLLILSGWLG